MRLPWLSGTAPNLTYKPTASFSGDDAYRMAFATPFTASDQDHPICRRTLVSAHFRFIAWMKCNMQKP
jgi:hypothetical protein